MRMRTLSHFDTAKGVYSFLSAFGTQVYNVVQNDKAGGP